MPRTCTTVPLRADESYKRSLRALADSKGVDMGDLVREAIDAAYSHDLAEYADLFAKIDHKNGHSSTISTTQETR